MTTTDQPRDSKHRCWDNSTTEKRTNCHVGSWNTAKYLTENSVECMVSQKIQLVCRRHCRSIGMSKLCW